MFSVKPDNFFTIWTEWKFCFQFILFSLFFFAHNFFVSYSSIIFLSFFGFFIPFCRSLIYFIFIFLPFYFLFSFSISFFFPLCIIFLFFYRLLYFPSLWFVYILLSVFNIYFFSTFFVSFSCLSSFCFPLFLLSFLVSAIIFNLYRSVYLGLATSFLWS